jgi:hypothetical protein
MGFGIWFQVWFSFFFFSVKKKKEKQFLILVSVLKIRYNPSSVWFVITTWIGTGS